MVNFSGKDNTFHWFLSIAILVVIVILLLNSGNTQVVTSTERKDSISVSGNAQLEVDPDQAEVYVRIETLASSAEATKDDNARISDKVTKALKKEGIKDDDIETTSFSLNPRYKYDRIKNENVLQGYTATHVLKVTTEDIDKAGKIIDTAVKNGANSIQNINFGLTKETQKEMNGEALTRASQQARDKAEALATSLRINLGKIISVQESNFDFVPYAVPRAEFAVAEAAIDTQINPGKVSVSARVTVAFEIR